MSTQCASIKLLSWRYVVKSPRQRWMSWSMIWLVSFMVKFLEISKTIWAIFFPRSRLVVHATWSVNENEKEKSDHRNEFGRSPFCRRNSETKLALQILDHRNQQKHNQARARPATEPRLPPARSPETRARKQPTRHR